ncbi:phosphate ABC transporter permease, partial [Pseudomonas syringae pv. tagetis]
IIGKCMRGKWQWIMARDSVGEQRVMRIRDFRLGSAPIEEIKAEQRRKGFIPLETSGRLGVIPSTALRTLLIDKVADGRG